MVPRWLLTELTVTSVFIKIQHFLVISLACEYMYIHLALPPVQSRSRDFFLVGRELHRQSRIAPRRRGRFRDGEQ